MRFTRIFLIVCALGMTVISFSQGFIQNRGQWPNKVLFAVPISSGMIFIERDGYTCHQWDLSGMHHADARYEPHSFDTRIKGHVWKVEFLNSSGSRFFVGHEALKTKNHYFLGDDPARWAHDCAIFKEVVLYGVYPGIDLHWHYQNGQIKMDWVVHSTNDWKKISWKYIGLDQIIIQDQELQLQQSIGIWKEDIPSSWYWHNGEKRNVKFEFERNGSVFAFNCNDVIVGEDLTIDPQLIFSTYSGSTSDNFGYTATYDQSGYLYSGSSAFGQGYPTSIGAYQELWGGGDGSGTLAGTDIAISKYDLSGTFMQWSTFIGGQRDELPHSLVVNENDEIWIYGSSGSSNFPITSNALDTTFNGGVSFSPQGVGTTYILGSDIVISHLSADGSTMLNSTFWGGSGNDGVNTATGLKFNYADEFRGEIDIDPSGNIVVVGTTNSADFPIYPNSNPNSMGMQDAFISVFNADMSQLILSRLVGGSEDESGCSVAFDSTQHIYLCGGTQSLDFSTTSGCYQNQYGGGLADGWLIKMNINGQILSSSYLGSSAYDQLYFVDTDEAGHPYVYGQSLAGGNTWIQNVNWFQENSGMIVVALNDNLSQVNWSTTFGSGVGVPNLSPAAFLVDVCGQIYLSGWGGAVNQMSNTQVGNTQNLWISSSAYQNTTTGSDFYLLVINSDASAPIYGSYYGGGVSAEHVDGGTSRFDRKGVIYQSVCAGCGNHDDFPIFPSNAVSSINASNNCNNGVFKYDFELSLTYALSLFETEICLGDSIYVQGQFQNANHLIWELDGSIIHEDLPSFWLAFSDTGNYYLNLIAVDSSTCNVSDQSGHWIHVNGPLVTYEPLTQICEGDSVLIGIESSLEGAQYQWLPNVGLSNDTLSQVVFFSNESQQFTLLIQHGLCTDTSFFEVMVNHLDLNLPEDTIMCNESVLNVEADFAPGNANLLWSDQLNFSNIIGQGGGYNWNLGDFNTLYAQMSLNGCSVVDSMHVAVLSLDAMLEDQRKVCVGDSLWLNVLNPINNVQYLWQPNDQIISDLDSSGVWIFAQSSDGYILETSIPGCSRVDTIEVLTSQLNELDFTLQANPSSVYLGNEVQLSAGVLGYNYDWSGQVFTGQNGNPENTLLPNASQWVYCTITDGDCIRVDSVFIKVEEWTCDDRSIGVPTAFSPNENNWDDQLYIYGADDLEIEWIIFDRWGNEVFKSNDVSIGWDGSFRGERMSSAVFHFVLKVKCLDGHYYQKEGNITLMR